MSDDDNEPRYILHDWFCPEPGLRSMPHPFRPGWLLWWCPGCSGDAVMAPAPKKREDNEIG